jgi:hypothetical protein
MKKNNLIWILVLITVTLVIKVYAVPVGPTVSLQSNSSMAGSSGTIVNHSGGYIYTVNLQGDQQNDKWKAYVGNITGNLVLRDSDGYSIYDWTTTTTVSGEVYATRNATTPSWSLINCSNSSHLINENIAINHTTNPEDNITATFNSTYVYNSSQKLTIGTIDIYANCSGTNLYVNSSNPSDDSWREVLLWDNNSVIYTSIISQDSQAYANGTYYDFQMILPENPSSLIQTAYYFYIELS